MCKKGSGPGNEDHHLKKDKKAKVVMKLDKTHDAFHQRKTQLQWVSLEEAK